MAVHNDDIITRMKNIEMIVLGKHRIRPWYFSPYPQVILCYVSSSLKTTEFRNRMKRVVLTGIYEVTLHIHL